MGATGAVIWCPKICALTSTLTSLPLSTALAFLLGPFAIEEFLVLEGLEYSACMGVCTGGTIALPSCFDQHAEVHMDGGTKKNILQLRQGDSVKDGGIVQRVTVEQGMFEFVEMALNDGNRINVTSPHLMVTYLVNGTKMLQPAMKVVSGDIMKNSEGDLQTVVQTRKFRAHEKIEVETTLGLLTVNGVETTSLCDNVMNKFPKGMNFEKVFIHLRDHTDSVPSLINNVVSGQ